MPFGAPQPGRENPYRPSSAATLPPSGAWRFFALYGFLALFAFTAAYRMYALAFPFGFMPFPSTAFFIEDALRAAFAIAERAQPLAWGAVLLAVHSVSQDLRFRAAAVWELCVATPLILILLAIGWPAPYDELPWVELGLRFPSVMLAGFGWLRLRYRGALLRRAAFRVLAFWLLASPAVQSLILLEYGAGSPQVVPGSEAVVFASLALALFALHATALFGLSFERAASRDPVVSHER